MRGLMDADIIEVDFTSQTISLTPDGVKWFDRAEDWLKEVDHLYEELVSQP